MANKKILEKKQEKIDEVLEKVKNSKTFIVFEYQGLTVFETDELRRLLRETNSELKVYKNTLVKKALDTLEIDLGEELNGPKAIAFGTDTIAPIKTLSEYAKKHPFLEIKIGYVDGEVTEKAALAKLATIPSRETLLTMVAAGLLGTVRDLAICLDLHSKKLEK